MIHTFIYLFLKFSCGALKSAQLFFKMEAGVVSLLKY